MKIRESVLKETIACVRQEDEMLAELLARILKDQPLPPPRLANDGYEDYCSVKLTREQIQNICHILLKFEANAVAEDGSTTSLASHYAGMVDFWNQGSEDG